MFKNLVKELREFIMRGNVIDMAVGIIIGAAFGKIIDSLVKDIIMPPIGLLLGKVDFSNLYWQIAPHDVGYPTLQAAKDAGAVTMNYGAFINTVISFLIVAFAVFMLIKMINKLQSAVCKKEEAVEEATTKECPYCFTTINIKATKCPNCTADLKPEKIS